MKSPKFKRNILDQPFLEELNRNFAYPIECTFQGNIGLRGIFSFFMRRQGLFVILPFLPIDFTLYRLRKFRKERKKYKSGFGTLIENVDYRQIRILLSKEKKPMDALEFDLSIEIDFKRSFTNMFLLEVAINSVLCKDTTTFEMSVIDHRRDIKSVIPVEFMNESGIFENVEKALLVLFGEIGCFLRDRALEIEVDSLATPEIKGDSKSFDVTLKIGIKYVFARSRKMLSYLVAFLRKHPTRRWQVYYGELTSDYHVNLLGSVNGSRKSFLADPFILGQKGNLFVFCEEYVYSTQKGHISCVIVSGGESRIHKVLEKDYHLSYPFIFEYEQDIYMIPESSSSFKNSIYKAEKFPMEWSDYETVLPLYRLIDPIMVPNQDIWFLIATESYLTGPERMNKIHVWSSVRPIKGTWMKEKSSRYVEMPFVRNGGLVWLAGEGPVLVSQKHAFDTYGQSVTLRSFGGLKIDQSKQGIIFEQIHDPQRKHIHHLNVTRQFIAWDSWSLKTRI